MKTFIPKATSQIKREWVLVDAKGKVLGRLASQIAAMLRGKNKPTFTPNVDMGDFVVVVNAGEIQLTGSKAVEKKYFWHTGYPGGIKSVSYGQLRETDPSRMLWIAVKNMLPRNKLRKIYLRKLKVYGGTEHPHVAQQPTPTALPKE